MEKKTMQKNILISILFVFIFAIVFISFAVIQLNARGTYFESFKKYCPCNSPNSLWTCTDGDIYFVSDKDGYIMGVTKKSGKSVYFKVQFSTRSQTFEISKAESLVYSEYSSLCFRGLPVFSKCVCVLNYYASTDKEQLFGDREGRVTLTFVRSDLPAPFSFNDEESLNELPFI